MTQNHKHDQHDAEVRQIMARHDLPEFTEHLREAVRLYARCWLNYRKTSQRSGLYDLHRATEAMMIRTVLEHTNNNQTLASRLLGISRPTLRSRCLQYGL